MHSKLPIDEVLPRLLAALTQNPSVVLRAPPGAGKTTRVPPALLDANLLGSGQIVMLEPRRVAARAAARRISEERGCRLGEEVGYQIRFDRRAEKNTRILVVTEGILVQMLQRDPFLEPVGAVIFDEFHERNLHSDLSLALCKRVQNEVRPDLKLVVMSATLDPTPIATWLSTNACTNSGTNACTNTVDSSNWGGGCAVVESEGRQHPVETRFLERPDPRSLPVVVSTAVRQVLKETPGDVLVFLPGVGEIRRTADMLQSLGPEVQVMPLYGDLSPEAQDAVLRPAERRKVVLATNVAETSITIDGVTAVVDSGLSRTLRFDPGYGLNRLQLGRISSAAADQRTGRAGRQGPGLCLRLWTAHDDRSLLDHETPEIRRVDLATTALELFAWGESDITSFDWFEAPDPKALERALTLLSDLGAVSLGASPRLTKLGRTLARLPVHPRLARLLVAGHRAGELRLAALCAALLSERDVVNRPTSYRPVVAMHTAASDLLDRVAGVESQEQSGYGETALGPVHPGRCRQLHRVARQLTSLAERHLGPGESLGNEEAMRYALLTAYPDRVARRRAPGGRRGVMVGGRGVRLAEMSAVHTAEFFLCLELDAGGHGHGEALVRQASAIEEGWLPVEEVNTRIEAVFDDSRERVVGRLRTTFRDLVLSEKDADPGSEKAAQVLAEAATERLEKALPQENRPFTDFLSRVRCLGTWMPDLGLPTFEDRHLAALLPTLAAGKRSFADLRKAPWLATLEGTLDYRQNQALKKYAPSHLEVPSGNRIRLHYEPSKAPVLAVRIQELFGLHQTPTVAAGRVPILLHLLAPNRRPQQVTDDLESFWRNTYPVVRKELKARYAKHSWPENPLTARAERRPRRRQ
jgi:ATP-dependent helicase HrpB